MFSVVFLSAGFLQRENVPESAERSFMMLITFITILQLVTSIEKCFTTDVILINIRWLMESVSLVLHRTKVLVHFLCLPDPIFVTNFASMCVLFACFQCCCFMMFLK